MTRWGTMKMTPEFMQELDNMEKAHNPEYKGRHTHVSVTTDGSDISREDVEAEVRKWVQARIDGKCKGMNSYPEDDRPRQTIEDFFSSLGGE